MTRLRQDAQRADIGDDIVLVCRRAQTIAQILLLRLADYPAERHDASWQRCWNAALELNDAATPAALPPARGQA
jgi:hypothetical protein